MEDSRFKEEEYEFHKEGIDNQLRPGSKVSHKVSDENTNVLMDYIYS